MINKVTEGLPFTSPIEPVPGSTPSMFSLSTVSLMDTFSHTSRHPISPFPLPVTCISATFVKEGQKTQLKLAYWGGDIFTHVNEKSGVRAAPQCPEDLLSLFHLLVPLPLSWLHSQTALPPQGAKLAAIALPCILRCSSPREKRKPSFTLTVKPKPRV